MKPLIAVNLAIRLVEKLFRVKLYKLEDFERALLAAIQPHPGTTRYDTNFHAEYYQALHDNDSHFRDNNWLVEEVECVLEKRPDVVLELGSGNGAFAKEIAKKCSKVFAVDWAVADSALRMPRNVEFLQRNVVDDVLPSADLVCSADFLEHLPPDKLLTTISKIVKSARLGFHKIACYDDGHSHLSILPAWYWLQLFQDVDSSYRVRKIQLRKQSLDKVVVVISNF